ncbi:hypothetical protein PHLGIDRAFT_80906 [Phlebiopsis gigantea 11061_1 CR5-6]|uniref:Terpene synthase n=1 Tax=Phlebiopsis gigantea (strain 11061_1 CR5-6) TaxID=745531 RepID=A0A0C3RYD0_PHLG1|nr:hypothetical protein PHLGIDRAFT_80906 [Phlebiopsis gigantea 11061_1 CR5-6]
MKSIGISIQGIQSNADGTVEKRTREQAAQWNLGDISLKRYEPALITSCDIASMAYSHTPTDVQVHIALYTLLAICIDDYHVSDIALGEFMDRMYSGTAQLHPLLDRFVENLRDMRKFFSPYASKLIIKSSIDFVNNMAVDVELAGMSLRPTALAYVTSKRFYNGIGDAYACFVWDKFAFPRVATYLQAVPDMNIFCDYVNDIFSFYKEELAHETKNFVHDRAFVTNKDVASALYDIVDETVVATNNVRQILVGEKEKQTWETFINTYLAFHLETPRYRLHEILGDEYH